ncbi:hypothetical protein DUNSADRAFT_16723 [Dunaliella salina]|uniref:Hydroxyproline O-arabinosyltransferase-like domain-containing protein n=1 Tax=Dunaliella salina TaxID=3046 RepID=A0ABQ7G309_DUNSA|nr:hypothetical protein DUNSADRAFT_16723 [Dunaliella salina]|eukprot:KAF5828994.1 hypothetical protein DUNSADRAFT_16723 [Dunaliella salina]
MRRTNSTAAPGSRPRLALLVITLFFCGYFLGLSTKHFLVPGLPEPEDEVVQGTAVGKGKAVVIVDEFKAPDPNHPFRKFRGDTIHALHTSSGGDYQNYQSRIMYASFKLVQGMPGGEKLTAYTRILHRTVPDYLMDEVPTFHVKPVKPQCDGWCDYPVANRPHAIKAWFDAAAKDPSMAQGAWFFMLEADYVWMRPMQIPGSAWDPDIPGVQYLFDYIQPWHPNAVPSIKKLYPGDIKDVPSSGPAPVLMRFEDFMKVVPTYVQASVTMEQDEDMKTRLGWVREMYAWDAAVAVHKGDVKLRTEHFPYSTTIVQPPFDVDLGQACMTHYTWGALYHEGIPSKGGKQVYRWEKRDIGRIDQTLKIQPIPMPIPFREGLFLEFDAPLTKPRHNLIVKQLEQMNRAIATLPDLTEYYRTVAEPRIQEAIKKRDEENKLGKAA